MVLFNYATKELTAKIVYYGPGLCGKTTNLQFVHENLPGKVKGKMLSLATKTDRTLFFDFLPLDLGEIRGMKTRVQLYTVPGQVFYNETRKLVLKGVDGIVFVADSQKDMLGPNVEAFKNLKENLKGHGISLEELPHVVQYNKRDLPKLSSIEEINASVNLFNAPFYESVATTGIGVKDTLNAITKLVLLHLTRKYATGGAKTAAAKPTAAKPAAAQPAAPAAAVSAPVAAETPARIPLANAATAVTPQPAIPVAPAAEPVTAAVEQPAAPAFEESEIDDLVSEVQASDLGVSGETAEAPTEVDVPLAPVESVGSPVDISAEITLTEAVDDQELFGDPSLEIARLEAGQTQDVIIPVEVGTRRFKLSLRLQLDAVD